MNLVEKHFPSPDQGTANEKPFGSGRGRAGANASKEMGLRDIFNEAELQNLLEGKDSTLWREQTGSNKTPREPPRTTRTTEGGDALSSDDDSSDVSARCRRSRIARPPHHGSVFALHRTRTAPTLRSAPMRTIS